MMFYESQEMTLFFPDLPAVSILIWIHWEVPNNAGWPLLFFQFWNIFMWQWLWKEYNERPEAYSQPMVLY